VWPSDLSKKYETIIDFSSVLSTIGTLYSTAVNSWTNSDGIPLLFSFELPSQTGFDGLTHTHSGLR
jgi:hypothetical protein